MLGEFAAICRSEGREAISVSQQKGVRYFTAGSYCGFAFLANGTLIEILPSAVDDTEGGRRGLDLDRTDMGIYKDSMDCYKDLCLEFKSDGTFKMNMEVPFILSSTGSWKVGGMNRWNSIRYDTLGLEGQISQPYLNENDTVLYFNSVTPKKSEPYLNGVNVVYFKKVQ